MGLNSSDWQNKFTDTDANTNTNMGGELKTTNDNTREIRVGGGAAITEMMIASLVREKVEMDRRGEGRIQRI